MVSQVRQLYSARDLLWAWTGRNVRGRYQQSAMGWLWAIIQPAATVIIFTIVFTYFVPVDTGETPYIVFSYVAVVPWTFLASSLTDMTVSLTQNMSLVTKIYFPREAIPVAATLARLMDFCVAATLVIFLIIYYQMPINLLAWSCLPLILMIQLMLILGVGLFLSAANIFFRDVQSFIRLGIQLWFYASPIIYPVSLVPEWLQPFYFLNPTAGILEAYRDILLNGHLPGTYIISSAIISFLLLIVGYWFFKRVEFLFADIV